MIYNEPWYKKNPVTTHEQQFGVDHCYGWVSIRDQLNLKVIINCEIIILNKHNVLYSIQMVITNNELISVTNRIPNN